MRERLDALDTQRLPFMKVSELPGELGRFARRRAPPAVWFAISKLPMLYTRDGARRMESAFTEVLLRVLSYTERAGAHSSLQEVKNLCDHESLARFSGALVQRWFEQRDWSEPRRGVDETRWALWSHCELGDRHSALGFEGPCRDTARPLEMRVAALETLVELPIVGELVLERLADCEEEELRERVTLLLKHAREKTDATLQGIAVVGIASRQVELLTRTFHAFGFVDGARQYELSGRTITVALDAYAQPHIVNLPEDHPWQHGVSSEETSSVEAEPAWREYLVMRRVMETSSEQVQHLFASFFERQQRWTHAQWRATFVQEPLFAPWSRGVVWCEIDAQGAPLGTFRVCEDDTLADADDAVYLLDSDEDSFIRIAHRGDLSASVWEQWATVLSDYELLSPVEQLVEDRFTHMDKEALITFLRDEVSGRPDVGRARRLARWHWQDRRLDGQSCLPFFWRHVSLRGESWILAVHARDHAGTSYERVGLYRGMSNLLYHHSVANVQMFEEEELRRCASRVWQLMQL